jgi:hypothetical protein
MAIKDTKVVKGADKRRPPNAGMGRQKGIPNKVTTEFRETVTKLLSDNSENVAIWLKDVAEGVGDVKPDPAKALDLLAKLAEYAAPKLARVEHTGKDGGPVVISATPLDERL